MAFEYTGDGCCVPKDVTSVRFKEELQKIDGWAFYNCTSLESITIPSTVTEIGANNAFLDCSNLREVTLNDGMQKIGDGAFRNCSSLESITLPSTVTEVGANAFRGCNNLRGVALNNGLQKIRSGTFFGCISLESFALPSTVAEVGANAFRGCSNLRAVILNDGLQKIGEGAFYNCTSLESIKLPSSLVEIGNTFTYCRNLREVELNGVPQYLHNEAFRRCNALERFLFPIISHRLVNIIQTSHWEELEDKVNEVRGVVQWESDELFISNLTRIRNWNDIREDLGRITRLVLYYEVKGATSTFELAMWKSKLDQADASNTTNRAAYRIDVPGPVKDTILQYLDHN